MLFWFQFLKTKLHSSFKTLIQNISFFWSSSSVYRRHKSVKYDLGGRETVKYTSLPQSLQMLFRILQDAILLATNVSRSADTDGTDLLKEIPSVQPVYS